MSDFLSNLIARSFAEQPAVRPRLPALFESAAAEPFAEVHSSAPKKTADQPSPPAIPTSSFPKKFAADQRATGNAMVDAAVNSPAETPPAPTDFSVTPREPVAVSSPRPGEKRVAEFSSEKTVVPTTSAPGGKKQDHTAKTQLYQELSERRVFKSGRQNSFSPVELRPSAPAIHVTIGRVEVRAIQSAAPLPKPAKPAPPKLSLDGYLQKRDGGAR